MIGMRDYDVSQDEHVAKEGQTNRKNKWQSQPPKRGQHSVTFLSTGLDEDEIREKFSECGTVTDIHTSHNRTFVRYNTEEEARDAEARFKDELGVSIAIRKDRNQKTGDGGKTSKMPFGPNEKIEVRVLHLSLSSSEEEARDEILNGANLMAYRFKPANDCNMMYVDFSTREDAQSFIDTWHQKEWRDKQLSVHFVEKKLKQANSDSRGQKRGDRQFSGQNRRRPEQDTEDNACGDVPRRETWEDNEPETSHSDNIYPGKGSTQTFSFGRDSNNNNGSKFSGGQRREQQDRHRYSGDNQDRKYGEGLRSPKNGGGRPRNPWVTDDSSSPRKFSNSRPMLGGGGSQDARHHPMKNQDRNCSGGNSFTYGGLKSKNTSQEGSEQFEAPLGEKELSWKLPSTPIKQQRKKGHNGPSPQKLGTLPSYSDDMPPLERMSLDNNRSANSPMPALEAVGNPVALPEDPAMPPLEKAVMPPLEMAARQPQPLQAAAPPVAPKQIEGLIITELPNKCADEIVVRALLKNYNVTDVNVFCKSGVFVKFNTQEEAIKACNEMHEFVYSGKVLTAKLQYEENSSELPGGSASAIEQQGTGAHYPLEKTLKEILEHYKVIASKLPHPSPPKPGQKLCVRITHIANTQCFWAQNIHSQDDKERLIKVRTLERNLDYTKIEHLRCATGGRCCAPYGPPGKEVYYRAWMLCSPNSPQYPVFFVDYGNVEIVPRDVVKRLDAEYWKEPRLAFPFKLKEGHTGSLDGIEEATLEIHEVDAETHLATCTVKK